MNKRSGLTRSVACTLVACMTLVLAAASAAQAQTFLPPPRRLQNAETQAFLSNMGSREFQSMVRTFSLTFGQEQLWNFESIPSASGMSVRISSSLIVYPLTVGFPFYTGTLIGLPIMQFPSIPFSTPTPTPGSAVAWQVWERISVPVPAGVQPWFHWQLRNWMTGMCIVDVGQAPAGGAVMEWPCDARDPRQLWGIMSDDAGRLSWD
jgi:hypothetical protein